MEKIVKEDFQYIEENLLEVIACLMRFVQNEYLEEALVGLELIEICADNIGKDTGLIDRRI